MLGNRCMASGEHAALALESSDDGLLGGGNSRRVLPAAGSAGLIGSSASRLAARARMSGGQPAVISCCSLWAPSGWLRLLCLWLWPWRQPRSPLALGLRSRYNSRRHLLHGFRKSRLRIPPRVNRKFTLAARLVAQGLIGLSSRAQIRAASAENPTARHDLGFSVSRRYAPIGER